MATTAPVPHRFNMSLADGPSSSEHNSSRVVPISAPPTRHLASQQPQQQQQQPQSLSHHIQSQQPIGAPLPQSGPGDAGDPMDVSTSPTRAAPPSRSALPVIDEPRNEGTAPGGGPGGPSHDGGAAQGNGVAPQSNGGLSVSMAAPSASAAANQPKVVQTAFIHKLYSMLEDTSLQHLISWSNSADSFVMSPSSDFSKALSQYFKHTNISSFVRQLNMYGFHKVSDVFHTSSPDSALWEFKHGAGYFKRGDLASLRDIKRRASRHSLVHREISTQKPPVPPPSGLPDQQMHMVPEPTDPRMIHDAFYDLNLRLQRQEESTYHMQLRQQAMTTSLVNVYKLSQELTQTVTHLVPHDNPVHRDIASIQSEMQRQIDAIRGIDEPPPPPHHAPHQPHMAPQIDPYARQPYYEPAQLSPHHPPPPPEDPRRATLAVPPTAHRVDAATQYRPAIPSNLSTAQRRYGSIGASPTQTSPSSARSMHHPQPGPHPLQQQHAPQGPPSALPHQLQQDMGRRHTAADIRAPGWPAGHSNGYQTQHGTQGQPSWPPRSPGRSSHEEKRLHESLSNYSIASQGPPHSRPGTPPGVQSGSSQGPPQGGSGGPVTFNNNFSWQPKENRNLNVRDSSVPPTRRTSVAHMLNPTSVEDDRVMKDEEDPRGDDDRKRKRLQ